MAEPTHSGIQQSMHQNIRSWPNNQLQANADPIIQWGNCSWMDVLDSIESARQQHQLKKDSNKLRAAQRNRSVAATLQSLADMIPDQDGLSILRGGLKTIFKFVEKRIENSERILAAFEDIPITFSNACNALRAYPNDSSLRTLVEGLFLALKTEIPKLIEILLCTQNCSFPRKLFKQHPENEAASINHALDLVTRASHKVSDQVNFLGAKTMVATLQETKIINEEVSKTHDELSKMAKELNSIQFTQHDLERNIIAYYDKQDRLTHAFVEKINRNLQQSLEAYELQFRIGFSGIQESLQGLMWSSRPFSKLEDSNHTGRTDPCECCTARRIPEFSHFQLPRDYCSQVPIQHLQLESSITLSYDDIYMILRLPDSYVCVQDLELIVKASSSMGEVSLSRAAWLLQMSRFQTWARTHDNLSDLILIDGHLGDDGLGKISPLSVLSATFASMNKIPNLLVLSHFCGLHTNPRDSMSGCRGMLLNLVAQLIMKRRQEQYDTVLRLSESLVHAMAQHDLNALCYLFQQLMAFLHQGLTVYVILDNISEFETSFHDWQEELSLVVQMFQSMTSQTRFGPTLKVLLTTANRSIHIFRKIEPENRVDLSARNQSPRSTLSLSVQNGWWQALGSS